MQIVLLLELLCSQNIPVGQGPMRRRWGCAHPSTVGRQWALKSGNQTKTQPRGGTTRVRCVHEINEVITTVALMQLICLAFTMCAAQHSPKAKGLTPMTYELYSWQNSKSGDWNFSILYNTSREKTVKEVFNKKAVLRGLDQIEWKISELPVGSTIIWCYRLPSGPELPRAKGSERLRYPPANIVQEIRSHAETRKIKIVGPQSVNHDGQPGYHKQLGNSLRAGEWPAG